MSRNPAGPDAKAQHARRLSPDEIAARLADDPLVQARARRTIVPQNRDGDAIRDEGTVREPARTRAVTRTAPRKGTDRRPHHDVAPTPDHTRPTHEIVNHNRIDLDDRRAFLENFRPRMPARDALMVREQVIALILDTAVTNRTSLERMMSLGSKFGVWCINNSGDGQFNPERDFTEDRLRDFDAYAYSDYDPGTAATYLSILRKLAGTKTTRAVKGRRVGSAPYPDSTKRLMWHTVADLEVWIGVELRTLLALAFGVGARSEEINQMRASQIGVSGRHTIVSITRRHIVRDVPVYDEYATWLRARAAELHPDDFIFRPTVTDRADAIGSLVRKAGPRSRVFEGFQARRARHTWVCELLQQPISYNAMRTAADIGVGSNLFADLSPHLPYVSPTQLRRAFDATHLTTKDQA